MYSGGQKLWFRMVSSILFFNNAIYHKHLAMGVGVECMKVSQIMTAIDGNR